MLPDVRTLLTRLPLLIALACSAAACGQKGPLILPDAKTKAPVPVTAPAVPNDKEKKDSVEPTHGP
jgi:predicted small lipoprotein YifL